MKTHERPATRKCSKCGKRKTFYEKSLSRQCKQCQLERSRLKYQKTKATVLARCAEYRKVNDSKIKRYLREWYEKNREHVLERCHKYNARPEVKERERIRQAARYAQNRDEIQASRRIYYEQNPEAQKRFFDYQQSYYNGNKHKFSARRSKRIAVEKHALPKWADQKAIAEFYVLAERKTRDTGIKHEVDHVIPLQGRNVCGLHVENNLRVISQNDNRKKSNKF